MGRSESDEQLKYSKVERGACCKPKLGLYSPGFVDSYRNATYGQVLQVLQVVTLIDPSFCRMNVLPNSWLIYGNLAFYIQKIYLAVCCRAKYLLPKI